LKGKKSPDLILMMETFSKEYGWTPKEMMEQRSDYILYYWQILTLRRKLENNQIKNVNK